MWYNFLMKKLFIVILFFVSISVFALPTWNPWCRVWAFYMNDQTYYFQFDRYGNVKDLDSGKIYKYDWDMEVLYIFDYKGKDYYIKATIYDNDLRFEGIEMNQMIEVEGHTSN